MYLLVAKGILRVTASPVEVNWFLDRVWLLFLSAFYLAGTLVLALKTPHAEDPLVRRQLKYLRNGALLGVVPFTLIYAVPYLFGALPGHYQKMAVLSMILMPLTWAYAILRYRLMDVDIIFQQGYVYTLATLVVLGIFYGLIFSFARPEDLSPAAIVGLILFATFIFQPIRDWLQEQLDRYFFYKDRYDYRRTLIEFARELGSETDLDEMLRSVADRLLHTLSIQHVAFFLANEPAGESDQFRLHMTLGNRKERGQRPGQELDLSFLTAQPGKPYLFFERTRHLLDAVAHNWPISVRRTIADLDLTYYFPCTVRGRTIAYLALSRTDKGDFLSSDDVELLTTLAGYVSIAVENTRLVPFAAAQDGGVRAAEGLQREYRRVHQRRDSGGGSERSGGELEYADRAADRDRARSGFGAAPGGVVSRRALQRVRPGTRADGRTQHLQVRAAGAGGPCQRECQRECQWEWKRQGPWLGSAHPEPGDRTAGGQGSAADRPADHFRRRHRSRRTGAPLGAGG